jgi:outer membrane receptor protein involved in Fe transport
MESPGIPGRVHKLSSNFEERIPLGFAPLDLTLSGNYSYRTSAQMLTDQNPQNVLPGFGILDLAAGLVSTSKASYSVTALVNNVTNKFYAVDVEDFWSALGEARTLSSGSPLGMRGATMDCG